MRRIDGIGHVATLTADFDRLAGFYADVFGCEVVLDETEDGFRHGMIALADHCVLHAFETPDNEHVGPGQPMFERGRIDHVALNVGTEEALEDLRRRLVERGAGGQVTDFGMLVSVWFADPDGLEGEVTWWRVPSGLAAAASHGPDTVTVD